MPAGALCALRFRMLFHHDTVSSRGQKMVNERLGRLKAGAVAETKKLLGVFLYLWVVLAQNFER